MRAPIEVFRIVADERDAGVPAAKDREIRARSPIVADKPAIAVLPFVNMSGEPEQDFFVDGITEDILTDLSPRAARDLAQLCLRLQGQAD